MESLTTEVEISFRFMRLNKLQAFTLEREILGSTYKEHCKNNDYVGYVPLTKKNLDGINDYYVRQRIEIDQCDIFILVTSESSNNSTNIPSIVNRMLKYIDCKLTFSFSIV